MLRCWMIDRKKSMDVRDDFDPELRQSLYL